uniref:Uncharacterized protein n=1 Tax=Romanomermis culicivorax TaxID=13658 RepID=A0A915J549_ROMCU
MRIEIVADCRGGCGFLGDSGHCDNHGDREDRHGHQNELNENGGDSGRSRQHCPGGRMKWRFATGRDS